MWTRFNFWDFLKGNIWIDGLEPFLLPYPLPNIVFNLNFIPELEIQVSYVNILKVSQIQHIQIVLIS